MPLLVYCLMDNYYHLILQNASGRYWGIRVFSGKLWRNSLGSRNLTG